MEKSEYQDLSMAQQPKKEDVLLMNTLFCKIVCCLQTAEFKPLFYVVQKYALLKILL